MFCYQCEQTANHTGCAGRAGVCGKSAEVADLQDELTGTLITLARTANELPSPALGVIRDGLFATLTNVNFDGEFIRKLTDDARAHIRAMQRAARMLRAGEDCREYHLDAELLHEFRQGGAEGVAYDSIVAAGPNACVLHYRADKAPVRSGDLVLIDAGCELEGYASDITRTFPANGTFTGPQRALYELVLDSQKAAIATRAGNRFNDPHDATVAVLAQGMLDLGLLDKSKYGNAQDVIAQRAYFQFYMHRTGHWLGMDVHDCGSYVEMSEVDAASTRTDALSGEAITRPSRILRPGMVTTIEPGIYVRPAPGVPEQFHHIGIRIEDDAVVTETGCELITRDVPVEADAIEALMRD